MEDNEAAQALAMNENMTKRSRFVDVRFHYVREMVKEKEVTVCRCNTADMAADLFTKALSLDLLNRHSSTVSGGTLPTATACSDTKIRK